MSLRKPLPRQVNTARVLAWAQQQIAEQNQQLRDAVETASPGSDALATVWTFRVETTFNPTHSAFAPRA
ncbi:MAG: hypothetical protein ACXVIJ_15395 [Thermoanaerobaculia bacterium]